MENQSTREIVAELEAGWPRWQIWVIHNVVGPPTWCARLWADYRKVLNAHSSGELVEYLTEADATVPDQP